MLNDTRAVKACSKCGEVKPLGEYHKQKGKQDGVRAECKVCRVITTAAYREANKDQIAAGKRAYYEANRDKVIADSRAYGKANPDKQNARNRAWAKANPEKIAEKSQRRRARKKANGVYQITNKDMRRIYGSPCAACGATGDMTADHVIPINRGGHHSIGNLQPLCGACNSSKHDRLMVEWMATRRSA